MIDLILFGHVQPGPVTEGGFQKGKKSTLEDDVKNLFICLPFLAVDEVAANINQVLDLLVPLLFVLEVLRDIKCLTDFAGVTHSLSLLFVSILLSLSHYIDLFNFNRALRFLLFRLFLICPWLFPTDLSKPFKNSREQSALHCGIS